MKMNTAIKQDWINALRSPRYTQGEGAMRKDNNAMCCLGVLCDRLDPDGWAFRDDSAGKTYIFGHRLGEGNVGNAYLKKAVSKSIGLDEELEGELMDMNDGGESFEEIARVIEARA